MSRLTITCAEEKDLAEIQKIYAYAREFMKNNGNPNQWKDDRPALNVLIDDIENHRLYIVKDGNEIHGVFAFMAGEDPTYADICGNWLSDSEYGTIHRVAGDGKVKGMFDSILDFCNRKISHLRIDTHEDNKIMRHLIEKNGFAKCGIIYVADGSPRIAYEKTDHITNDDNTELYS